MATQVQPRLPSSPSVPHIGKAVAHISVHQSAVHSRVAASEDSLAGCYLHPVYTFVHLGSHARFAWCAHGLASLCPRPRASRAPEKAWSMGLCCQD